jgi:nicotinate phosphoribosyltransferase
LFHVASDEKIRKGETTDIYFVRAKEVLSAKELDQTQVVAEVTSGDLPQSWSWGVLCGVEELANLFQDMKVDVYAMPEGSVFFPQDYHGFSEPVLRVEGAYGEFCLYETPLLGLICQASGIATRAARLRKIVGDKQLVSFGIRRMHPSISPMIDRAAFIGGFDSVSSLSGARAVGIKPTGTMPHAIIVIFGNQVEAWKAFDSVVQKDVPRVALVDTYCDEKKEAVMAAEALPHLDAVRLDTPSSRKGDFQKIISEVRWELDLRHYENVGIFVSGGLNEDTISELSKAGADAFGVGTYVSNAPTVNFALDIIEVKGIPCAKRGKLGGAKEVWRCSNCMIDKVLPIRRPRPDCPNCGKRMEQMLKPLVRAGKIVGNPQKPKRIREQVCAQLKNLSI